MSAGMAEVIAAHAEIEWEMETGRAFCECGAALGSLSAPTAAQHRRLYRHAARELAKAGYGKLPTDAAGEIAGAADELQRLARWPKP